MTNGFFTWWIRRLQRIPKRLRKEFLFRSSRRSLRTISARTLLPHPRCVLINTCTICNANCIFCGYQHLDKAKKKVMPDEVFLKAAEEIGRLAIKSVCLTPVVGDPLVDAKILARIEILRRKGVETISLYTNGIAVNKIGAADLIRRGPDIINISTCGFDANEFARIYRSDKYIDVIEGIAKLLEENSRLNGKRTIGVSVISDSPRKVVLKRPDAVRLLALGATIHFTFGIDDWHGAVSEEDLSQELKSQMRKPPTVKGPCHALFRGLSVHPDGQTSACGCRDIDQNEALHLGNLCEQDLDFMHQKVVDIIEHWKSGYIPEICRTCKVYGDSDRVVFDIIQDVKSKGPAP